MAYFSEYSIPQLTWIALVLVVTGMHKGGFPVGLIGSSLMILIWPDQSHSARNAIGFLLPLLCLMDVFGVYLYRTTIDWKRLTFLWPGTLFGIGAASVLFISDSTRFFSVSESTLKICIGALGLLFIGYYLTKKIILSHLEKSLKPGLGSSSLFGVGAGLTSTLADAAAPVMQMYLLPQRLPKKWYIGTNGAFFLVINLIKLIPFVLLGHISSQSLILGGVMLPTLPIGVGLGFWLAHKTNEKHYNLMIYAVLLVTSILLIGQS